MLAQYFFASSGYIRSPSKVTEGVFGGSALIVFLNALMGLADAVFFLAAAFFAITLSSFHFPLAVSPPRHQDGLPPSFPFPQVQAL